MEKMSDIRIERHEKIKTNFAKIIVEGNVANPYYSILYYDCRDGKYYNGFGSYFLEFVFNWLEEYFERVEEPIVCMKPYRKDGSND